MRSLLAIFAAALTVAGCATGNARTYHPTVAFAAEIPAEALPRVASCDGLPDDVRRTPIFRKADVHEVTELKGPHRIGARNQILAPRGARVVIAASPSATAPWLERVAQCQVDMYSASGHSAGDEPLSVHSARVDVSPVHGGFAIDITSESFEAAREIYARARTAASR